jgi:hypothetical protein
VNQWKAAQSWGHQRYGEGKGCSCDKASQRCRENSLTDIFGSSAMVAPLRPEPFPGRGPGTMPAVEPLASSSLGKALSGIRRGLPPLLGRRRRRPLPPSGEGCLQEKVSPLDRRNWRMREGSGPVPKDKTSGRMAGGSCQDLRVTPRERAWGMRGGSPLRWTCRRHHYHIERGNDGLDWLVKSHRCSARRSERIARGLALQGYDTAQSHVTSVTHVVWPLWYPLEYKRRARPR